MSETRESLPMQWMTLEDVYGKTVSYAQNYEDILISRVLPSREGFYIDVGANHPVFHSVTKLFYERGWRGINIEPSPDVYDVLAADRPRDLNLNVGIGLEEEMLTFFEVPSCHGWSTFRRELAEHYRTQGVPIVEKKIPVTTLMKVCQEHVGETIDFLKIDAEGFEREVILGSDFTRWRPRILIIENAWPADWESLLEGIDYRLAASDGINRFYLRFEDLDLLPGFASTVNAIDNFVPYEYLRLIQNFEKRIAERTSIVDVVKRDARRIGKRLRSALRGFHRRAS